MLLPELTQLQASIDEVAKHLASQDAPTVSSARRAKWTVLGLARAGKITDEIADSY